MGLHSFSGSHPTQSDALVAKNYCTEDELLALNDIVSAYLDLAEMQARRRIPMYMSDWIDTLDGFLKLSKHEILTHAGKISAAAAEKKAKEEYRKYKELQSAELSRGEKDYIAALESAEQKMLKKERSISDSYYSEAVCRNADGFSLMPGGDFPYPTYQRPDRHRPRDGPIDLPAAV